MPGVMGGVVCSGINSTRKKRVSRLGRGSGPPSRGGREVDRKDVDFEEERYSNFVPESIFLKIGSGIIGFLVLGSSWTLVRDRISFF